MTREWRPGDLAHADLSTGERGVLLRRAGVVGDEWWQVVNARLAKRGLYEDAFVRNIRPAVVLDPADLDGVADWIRGEMHCYDWVDQPELKAALDGLVSAITPAIDKLRMSEPEWGEKVSAHTEGNRRRRNFVGVMKRWTTEELEWMDERGSAYEWDELIGPEPAS